MVQADRDDPSLPLVTAPFGHASQVLCFAFYLIESCNFLQFLYYIYGFYSHETGDCKPIALWTSRP